MGFEGIDEIQKRTKPEISNGRANKLAPQDRAFHDWYRFVLSFPPHLVRDYLQRFELKQDSVVLDPFCGTGTTLVEAKLAGLQAIGLEGNPFPCFASSVKTDWRLDAGELSTRARKVAEKALEIFKSQGIDDNLSFSEIKNVEPQKLSPENQKLILANSISPLPLHKTLVLIECLKQFEGEPFYRHALLALGNAIVFKISNLHFGPEVGVKKPKTDVPVVSNWLMEIDKIANDLRQVAGKSFPETKVHLADARSLDMLEPNSIDAVITSPPYPNEKDYTRTTRLESVLLGFINSKEELRALKRRLVRSNTRGIYKEDDDDQWISEFPEIQRIADEIEKRRIELGKDSGFERLYPRAAKLYFGGMARHLADLRRVLRPGAQLAYVVGDQASYLRVMIRTGQILGNIAQKLGYELTGIDLFRTRLATATKEQLREEVVLLKWRG
ncbi:MAG: DNA methyltransferase [Chloroflexi bacterium]|nr:DNA methyltransferase [Chloroflexota bacterium]MBI5702075.1 DNA methyltransferase [Chloroflexota bacterium]